MMQRRHRPVAPSSLDPQAGIGVFSPSEPLFPSRRERVEANADRLRSAGHEVIFADNCFNVRYHSAGTVTERVADIHQLLDDPRVGALLGAWGGKTCNELLNHIDYERVAAAKKPIAGFSDVAVLLNAIAATTNLITFHGPNILGKLDESTHLFERELATDGPMMRPSESVFGDTSGATVIRPGSSQGVLFGGNLSTFVLGLTGSEQMDKMKDPILFWESAGERPQLLVQHLVALRNADFLGRLKGMVVGAVEYEDEGYEYQPVDEAILDSVADFDFPIVRIPTFGHQPLENPVIPIGARCAISTDPIAVRSLDAALV